MGTRFAVPFEWAFEHGLEFLGIDRAIDFDRRGQADDQARDEHGVPVWIVTTIDRDPEARKFGRSAEVKIRIASHVEPVPPAAVRLGSVTVQPVAFKGLSVLAYVDSGPCRGTNTPHRCKARLAWSYRAEEMVSPDQLVHDQHVRRDTSGDAAA